MNIYKTRGKIRCSGRVSIPAPHAARVMTFPMSYQGNKNTHDNNIMAYRCHWLW